MFIAFPVKGGQVFFAASGDEPFRPVGYVGPITDTIRSPPIVGVADKVIVFPQFDPKTAMIVGKPVLTAGVMYKDELNRMCWRPGIGRQPFS